MPGWVTSADSMSAWLGAAANTMRTLDCRDKHPTSAPAMSAAAAAPISARVAKLSTVSRSMTPLASGDGR